MVSTCIYYFKLIEHIFHNNNEKKKNCMIDTFFKVIHIIWYKACIPSVSLLVKRGQKLSYDEGISNNVAVIVIMFAIIKYRSFSLWLSFSLHWISTSISTDRNSPTCQTLGSMKCIIMLFYFADAMEQLKIPRSSHFVDDSCFQILCLSWGGSVALPCHDR